MRALLFLLLFLSLPNSIFPQSKSNPFISARLNYGFILPHNKTIEYNVEQHISGFEVNIERRNGETGGWDKLYKYPYTGLGYTFSTLGNPEVYGNAHALYPYIAFPFKKEERGISFYNKLSVGLGYVTKVFDLDNNYRNLAMGTHLNLFFRYSVEARINITNRSSILLGVGFSHLSNGKLGMRNHGLNIISSSMAYRFSPFTPSFVPDTLDMLQAKKKNQFTVVVCGGVKTATDYNNTFYPVFSFVVDYGRLLSKRNRVVFGTDIFYNKSLSYIISSDYGSYKTKDLFSTGLHVGHELIYKRISLTTELGYYLYARYKLYNLYSRIGLRYYASEHLILNISLKAHKAIADFVEWGAGYRF